MAGTLTLHSMAILQWLLLTQLKNSTCSHIWHTSQKKSYFQAVFYYDLYCTCVLCITVELFPFGPEAGDNLFNVTTGVGLPSPIIFAGANFSLVFINYGGLLSLGDQFFGTPRDFPFNSIPLIAPFWADLSSNRSGNIYYRVLTNQTVIDRLSNGVDILNNEPTGTYRSISALLVTWQNVPLTSGEGTGVFQAALTSNGSQSYLFLTYSDYTFPSGAVIGINVGNGNDSISLATAREGNSIQIAYGSNVPMFQTRGVYGFRLDSLVIGDTPAPPTFSTPTLPPCMDGDYMLSISQRLSNVSDSVSGVALVCVDGVYGGICSSGFDDSDALVLCRSYFMQLGLSATGKRGNFPCGNMGIIHLMNMREKYCYC